MLKRSLGMFGTGESEKDSEWQNWYAEQQRKLDDEEEIEPPWIAFPNSSPIHGWNQGYQQEWKNNVWLPFWRGMTEAEREDYLNRRQASSEWRETLTVYWVADLSESSERETRTS